MKNLGMGKKFLVPPPPIMLEESNGQLVPTDSWKNSKRIEYLMKLFDAVNEGKNPVKGGNELKGDQQLAMLQAIAVQLNAAINANMDYRINKEFITTFGLWLRGISKWNASPKTPWKTTSLSYLPDVAAYLEQFIDMKIQIQKILAQMKAFPPKNLKEAWLYFKYIVMEYEIDGNEYLPEWNWWTDPRDWNSDKARLGSVSIREEIPGSNPVRFKKYEEEVKRTGPLNKGDPGSPNQEEAHDNDSQNFNITQNAGGDGEFKKVSKFVPQTPAELGAEASTGNAPMTGSRNSSLLKEPFTYKEPSSSSSSSSSSSGKSEAPVLTDPQKKLHKSLEKVNKNSESTVKVLTRMDERIAEFTQLVKNFKTGDAPAVNIGPLLERMDGLRSDFTNLLEHIPSRISEDNAPHFQNLISALQSNKREFIQALGEDFMKQVDLKFEKAVGKWSELQRKDMAHLMDAIRERPPPVVVERLPGEPLPPVLALPGPEIAKIQKELALVRQDQQRNENLINNIGNNLATLPRQLAESIHHNMESMFKDVQQRHQQLAIDMAGRLDQQLATINQLSREMASNTQSEINPIILSGATKLIDYQRQHGDEMKQLFLQFGESISQLSALTFQSIEGSQLQIQQLGQQGQFQFGAIQHMSNAIMQNISQNEANMSNRIREMGDFLAEMRAQGQFLLVDQVERSINQMLHFRDEMRSSFQQLQLAPQQNESNVKLLENMQQEILRLQEANLQLTNQNILTIEGVTNASNQLQVLSRKRRRTQLVIEESIEQIELLHGSLQNVPPSSPLYHLLNPRKQFGGSQPSGISTSSLPIIQLPPPAPAPTAVISEKEEAPIEASPSPSALPLTPPPPTPTEEEIEQVNQLEKDRQIAAFEEYERERKMAAVRKATEDLNEKIKLIEEKRKRIGEKAKRKATKLWLDKREEELERQRQELGKK